MSKHDTFSANLVAITGVRPWKRAARQCVVKRSFVLPEGKEQACELCGTRFRDGAEIAHPKRRATFLVGGTCRRSLVAEQFPARFDFPKAKRTTTALLRTQYGTLVDPGNWLKWVREEAPSSLHQAVDELCVFGTTADPERLRRLIRFHDRTRRFSRRALLDDPVSLQEAIGVKIDAFITIEQARKYQRMAGSGKAAARLAAAAVRNEARQFQEARVLPALRRHPALEEAWALLRPLDRRSLTALIALEESDRLNLAAPLADRSPQAGSPPMFVWNLRVGIGFVAADDIMRDRKAQVWLWATRRYQPGQYNLAFWRGVAGCSTALVDELETLAFGRPPARGRD